MNEALKKELEREDHKIRILRQRADKYATNHTVAEEKLRKVLSSQWIFQVALLNYIVDFLNPEKNVVIELYGVGYEKVPRKILNRDWRLYKELGLYTIRIYAAALNKLGASGARKIVEEFCENPIPPKEPVVSDEEIKQKITRREQLKFIHRRVDEFERAMFGKSRSQVLCEYATWDDNPEVKERLWKLVMYWPENGYTSSGLQTHTFLKRNS